MALDPRRIESHRRSPSPAASPKLFEARRENAFFFGININHHITFNLREIKITGTFHAYLFFCGKYRLNRWMWNIIAVQNRQCHGDRNSIIST